MANSKGFIKLVRKGKIDRELDSLDREPISMRTYLSLIAESINKKRDLVLGLVVPDRTYEEISCNDDISVEIVGKGIVYLAECINMHRFSVSFSNPNIISVFKKNVVDPNMKCPIKTIYYYSLKYTHLKESINSKDKEISKTLNRVMDDSPDAVSELALANPIVFLSEWIGTENDYLKNSVFHMYLEQNKILGYIYDAKNLYDKEIQKEQAIFKMVLWFFLGLIALSFAVHAFTKGITILEIFVHVFISILCILLLIFNVYF